MAERGYAYAEISQLLQVSEPFISKWKTLFAHRGVDGLRLGYRGGQPFLTDAQRTEVLTWLTAQPTCDRATLKAYLQETYGVVYQSKQSYYDLFSAAGFSWKKVQTSNPQKTMPWWQPNELR